MVRSHGVLSISALSMQKMGTSWSRTVTVSGGSGIIFKCIVFASSKDDMQSTQEDFLEFSNLPTGTEQKLLLFSSFNTSARIAGSLDLVSSRDRKPDSN